MEHEYDQNRKHSRAMDMSHHGFVEPGQSSRSHLLRRPEQPIASGLVQRKALDTQVANAQEPQGRVHPVQRKAAERPMPPTASRGSTAMPAVVQAKMEDAFGVDFSAVRIHQGPEADAIGAHAFTQGTDIHFGAGEYAPHDLAGQALLGHELAHIVQQSSGRVQPTTQAKGLAINDDGGLEREADEAGAQAARGEKVTMSGAGGGGAAGAIQAKAAGAPIQMAPKDTHYGRFTDEKYDLGQDTISMVLKFSPNAKVDATKIGLTQSLRTYIAGVNDQIDPTTAGRTSRSGHYIDAPSTANNPLYGDQPVGNDEGLKDTPESDNGTKDPTELNPDKGDNANYQLGHGHDPGNGWVTKDAGLYDDPSIDGGNNSGKEFETAALAVDGNQAGTYYGSVKWGWKKSDHGQVSLIDFDVVSMGAPSKEFFGAATAWNSGTVRGTLVPKANGTEVVNGNLQVQFTMDTNETATQEDEVMIDDVGYISIKVTSQGANKDKTGYVKGSDFKDRGDGNALVPLPIIDVKKTNAQAALYDDAAQSNQLQTLAQGTRVKATATQGLLSKVEVVDGAEITKVGWVLTSTLAAE